MCAFAGGNLLGFLVAGSLPRPDGAKFRLIMIVLFVGFRTVIGSLGVIASTWIDFGLLFLISLGNGFLAILLMIWMRTRTPQEMLGRMMSLLVLSSTRLMSISMAVARAVSKWNLTMLFIIPRGLILLMTVWMALHPDLKRFSESLTAASPTKSARDYSTRDLRQEEG